MAGKKKRVGQKSPGWGGKRANSGRKPKDGETSDRVKRNYELAAEELAEEHGIKGVAIEEGKSQEEFERAKLLAANIIEELFVNHPKEFIQGALDGNLIEILEKEIDYAYSSLSNRLSGEVDSD